MTKPLFNDEGPSYYAAAYKHNAPFAKPGPYQTPLSPTQEAAFRHWLAQNKVQFDPNATLTDYDMRGFWLSGMRSGREPGGQVGYPDTYKTPYDTTFSGESKYATPNCPFKWVGDNLIDQRNGQLIFSRSGGVSQSGYGTRWHAEVKYENGSVGQLPLRMISDGHGETHWETAFPIGPRDEVRIVSHSGSISSS
jgi:hypothetical protein